MEMEEKVDEYREKAEKSENRQRSWVFDHENTVGCFHTTQAPTKARVGVMGAPVVQNISKMTDFLPVVTWVLEAGWGAE